MLISERKIDALRFYLLSLSILALPSLEAPKNLFIALFLLTWLLEEKNTLKIDLFDSAFIFYITSAFLSSIIAPINSNLSWKNFFSMLFIITFGLMLKRLNLSNKKIIFLYFLTLLSIIPPLIFGFYQLMILKNKEFLELHSVGYVNHSAIYLVICFGVFVGLINYSLKIKLSQIKLWGLIAIGVLLFYSILIGQSRAAFSILLILIVLLGITNTASNKMKGILIAIFTITFLCSNFKIIEKETKAVVSNENSEWIFMSKEKNVLLLKTNIAVSAGKWYWEVTPTNVGSDSNLFIGVQDIKYSSQRAAQDNIPNGFVYKSDGYKLQGKTQESYATRYKNNDVIGLALNMDDGTLRFYKNNKDQGMAYAGIHGKYSPLIAHNVGGFSRTSAGSVNFGQKPFAFEPPSGFEALNTYNKSAPIQLEKFIGEEERGKLQLKYEGSDIFRKIFKAQSNSDNLNGRKKVWNVSFEAARFSPFFGIGNGNWKEITLEKIKKNIENRNKKFIPENYEIKFKHSHSLYLSALVERGIFGLAAILVIMILWLISLKKDYELNAKLEETNYLGEVILTSSFAAWLATFIIGAVNSTFHHETAIISIMLFSLQLNYFRKIREKFGIKSFKYKN